MLRSFYCSLFFTFIVVVNIRAQEFAPIGSNWKYIGYSDVASQGFNSCDTSDCGGHFIQLNSIGTITIDGKQCKQIERDATFDCDPVIDIFTVYEEEGRYYFQDWESGEFLLYMDINLGVGDTLKHYAPRHLGYSNYTNRSWISTDTIADYFSAHSIVTSIEWQLIGELERKVLAFETLDEGAINYPVIEKFIEDIGHQTAFFGVPNGDELEGCSVGFWCYGFEGDHYSKYDDCLWCHFPSVPTSTNEIILEDLAISPNLVFDQISIQSEIIDKYDRVMIINSSGKVNYQGRVHPQIDVSSYSSGIYWLKFYGDKIVGASRFVKM